MKLPEIDSIEHCDYCCFEIHATRICETLECPNCGRSNEIVACHACAAWEYQLGGCEYCVQGSLFLHTETYEGEN